MNFDIRYLSEYHYDRPVTDSLNALRVRPASTARQQLENFELRIDPETRLHHHDDYFGTYVSEFGIAEPHQQLTIDVRARVSTESPAAPPEAPWDAITTVHYREAGTEFLLLTDSASGEELAEMREQVRSETPLATVQALIEMIPDRFEYRSGITYVDSTVSDLINAGAGVCQDFVHLGLAILRRTGIAARYVSGYLFAAPPDGGTESVEVDTHAWLEALLPSDNGNGPTWVGVDPTNRTAAGERHVKIGHGRNYQDVPPIKGVFRGDARSELSHRVTMALSHDEDPASEARST
jgi:transglutaminase-like putative cysteine protease